ncbi:2-phospho-L-lactate transferase [Actinokineospora inagensis]|uniref:2-phospho-L-lactate transferase n=1 Tax=Actinokineospora inagensis TaxID=103730 RepID=UPI000413D362|nr:2-phospho-L-lactate transferase [Actinokineospora inagensis]
MKVVVVVGGVGGARFLLGVKRFLGLPPVGEPESASEHSVTAVVNTGDDIWMHGLRICPDLDTCMYTLGGGIDTERGWGHAGESWAVKAELAAYGAEPDWFGLGDKDIATHLVRTRMMRAGYELSDITAALCDRWRPGVRLLPMTDDRVETHVVIDEPGTGERKAVHFQEWWVRYRAEPRARSIVPVGADEAAPAPGVAEAIAEADVVLLAPSNPVVSVGTVLAVPGVRTALRKTEAPVVGVSPIIGGKPVRGMADACLEAIGLATSAEAVGRHYGSRACSESGVLDGWLVSTGDSADVPGVAVRAVPLLMSDVDATATMVLAALELGGVDLG